MTKILRSCDECGAEEVWTDALSGRCSECDDNNRAVAPDNF